MKRRHTFAVIALVGFGLLMVSLGARTEDDTRNPREYCAKDLETVFEICEPDGWSSGCKYEQERVRDACQAGCVLHECPEQVPCTGLDPMWCKRCDNPRGALFWSNRWTAGDRCHEFWDKDMPAYHRCFKAAFKDLCPVWTGKWPRPGPYIESDGLDDLGPDE